MVCRTLLLTFAALLYGSAASASPCPPCRDPRLGQNGAALEQIVERAGRQGLAPAPLVALVREGLAKRIPPPRVLAGANKLAGDLATAGALIAGSQRWPSVPTTLPMVLVEGLRAGVQPNQLRALIVSVGRYGAERTSSAIETLTDLQLRGFPAAATLPLVQRAAASRRDLLALPEALERQRRRTRSVDRAIVEIALGLSRGEDLERAAGGPGNSSFGRSQGQGLDESKLRGPNRETSQGRGPGPRGGGREPPGKGAGKGRGPR